jgi:hypothetical protein
LLVSLAASSRKIKVSVESIGFLVVRGVAVSFAQVRPQPVGTGLAHLHADTTYLPSDEV